MMKRRSIAPMLLGLALAASLLAQEKPQAPAATPDKPAQALPGAPSLRPPRPRRPPSPRSSSR
jgi:hypothetical protein